MPLPPAPAKRAALLTPEAHDHAVAVPAARTTRKPAPAPVGHSQAARPQGRESRDPTGKAAPARPIAEPELDLDLPADSPVARSASGARRRSEPVAQAATAAAVSALDATARKARPKGPAKLFVIDTNVLMHDPMCLFRFEEHDIFLPMIVLEELDGHKKGMTEVARNARQASRTLDGLAGARAPTSRRASNSTQQGTARRAESCSSRPNP